MINPWSKPQKRIELPRYRRLYLADEADLNMLKVFEAEAKIEVFYEPNDDTDYAIHNADGSVTRVSECITINGTQWLIVPGKNLLPRTVYEFLLQCPEQRRRVTCPQPGVSRNLGLISAAY